MSQRNKQSNRNGITEKYGNNQKVTDKISGEHLRLISLSDGFGDESATVYNPTTGDIYVIAGSRLINGWQFTSIEPNLLNRKVWEKRELKHRTGNRNGVKRNSYMSFSSGYNQEKEYINEIALLRHKIEYCEQQINNAKRANEIWAVKEYQQGIVDNTERIKAIERILKSSFNERNGVKRNGFKPTNVNLDDWQSFQYSRKNEPESYRTFINGFECVIYWLNTKESKPYFAEFSLSKGHIGYSGYFATAEQAAKRLTNEANSRQKNSVRRNGLFDDLTEESDEEYLEARLDKYYQDETDIDENSQMFHGEKNGDKVETLASKYCPKMLSRIGFLEYLILENGDKIEFDDTKSFAAQDRRKNVYLVGTGVVFSDLERPALNELAYVGKVHEISYRTRKAHIGNNRVISFYHNFGEVDGVLPTLLIDDEGFPVLIGGNYTIKKEGIIN